jgi:hypothetical protein
MTKTKVIDDAKLTRRAFKRNDMLNPVGLARDGVEAFDVVIAPGAYAERAGKPPPPERVTA